MRVGRQRIDDLIVREKPSIWFDDVAGLEDVKENIRLKMLYPFAHPELAERFGINAGGGVSVVRPAGNRERLMLAKATGQKIDATFFRVSSADLLSKWVGEAEQNIKKLFDSAAGELRAIIFIDEIESLVPARRDEGSSVMQRVVPQILQGMEGFDKTQRHRWLLFAEAANEMFRGSLIRRCFGREDLMKAIPLPDLTGVAKNALESV